MSYRTAKACVTAEAHSKVTTWVTQRIGQDKNHTVRVRTRGNTIFIGCQKVLEIHVTF